jgi:hypothetical protein
MVFNNGTVYFPAGNVGIGTTAPTAKLQVVLPANTISSIFQSTASEALLNIQTFPTTNRMQLLVGDYNATAAPNIAAISDSNTGIQWSGSDVLKFVNGGSENVTINASGNVGIGTTSPSAKLDVSVSSGAAWMNLINESEPAFRLTTYNNGTGSGTSAYAFKHGLYYNATENASVTFYRGGSSIGGFLTFTTDNGSERMRIDASGNVSIGTTSAAAKLHVDGAIRTSFLTSGNAFLEIYSGSVAGYIEQKNDNPLITIVNGSERMRITSAGNVGIGTTSPGFRLDVAGAVSDWATRFYSNASASAYFANGGGYGGYIDAGSNASSSTYLLQLISNGSSRVYVRGDGNVGIGTTSPTEKLHVVGNAKVEGSIGVTNIVTNYVVKFNGSILDDSIIYDNGTNVGIGTTSPSEKLHVVGTGYFTSFVGIAATTTSSWGLAVGTPVGADGAIKTTGSVQINSGALAVGSITPSATAGRIDASNDIVAYSTSDSRLKENITPIANALDKVKSLTGVEFDWKEETKDVHGYEGHDVGVIAQEVQAVLPEAIRTNDSGYLSVRYEKMIALLIEANKELAARVEELERKLK